MANIGAVLKDEIARLSRKEVRRQVESIRKASTQYRRHIATLKRDVAALRREIARLSGKVKKNGGAAIEPTTTSTRFAPKGLKTHRLRLGLSANDYGKLVGVSAQSVYNWEQGLSRPRAGQRATLAALRSVGKREASARLQQLNGSGRGR